MPANGSQHAYSAPFAADSMTTTRDYVGLPGRASLVSPAARLAQQAQRLDELEGCLRRALERTLRNHRERLGWLIGRASLVNPAVRVTHQVLRLDSLQQRLERAWQHDLRHRRSLLSTHQGRLWQLSPMSRLRSAAANHAALAARLKAAALDRTRVARERFLPLARTLHAVSPLATLDRGYAIVSTVDGHILRDPERAPPGTVIQARLARGTLRAKVEGAE